MGGPRHRGRRRDRRRELAVAGAAQLEAQAEPTCAAPGGGDQRRVVGLGEVDEPLVVAEVRGEQLRVAVEPEPDDDEPVEVAGEEVGEEERRGLVRRSGARSRRARHRTRSSGRRAAARRRAPRRGPRPACRPCRSRRTRRRSRSYPARRRRIRSRTASGMPPGRLWSVAGRQVMSTLGRPRVSRPARGRARRSPTIRTRARRRPRVGGRRGRLRRRGHGARR